MKSVLQIDRRMIRDYQTVEKNQPKLRRVFGLALNALARGLSRLTLEAHTAKGNMNNRGQSVKLEGVRFGDGKLSREIDWDDGVRIASRGEPRLSTPSKLSPWAAWRPLVALPFGTAAEMSGLNVSLFDISS